MIATVPRVDARGERCPLPTLMAALALEKLSSGDRCEVWADDPATRRDFPAWCAEFGHTVLNVTEEEGVFRFTIAKC